MNLLKSMRGQWRLAPLVEIAVGLAILLAIGLGVVLALSGCGPARPPVTTGADECVPNATRCAEDGTQVFVCSASHRWQPTAAEPCPSGTACCTVTSLDPGGQVHACAPADACVEPLPGGNYAPPAPPPEAETPAPTATTREWSSQ